MQNFILWVILTIGAVPCMGHFHRKFVWFEAVINGVPITEVDGCAEAYAMKEINKISIIHGKSIQYRDHITDDLTEGDKIYFCNAMIKGRGKDKWKLVEYEVQEANVIANLVGKLHFKSLSTRMWESNLET